MKKTISFKTFCSDFKNFYKCDEVNIKNEIEAEVVFWDLYECDLFEFNYEDKLIELYY